MMTGISKATVTRVYMSDYLFEYYNHYAEGPGDHVGTYYHVIAELTDGRRYEHYWGLPSSKFSHCECKERVERMVRRIDAHLDDGGSLNIDHWRAIDPVYGSEAWERFERGELARAADYVRAGGNPDALSDTVASYL
jgi:hypothetical protein